MLIVFTSTQYLSTGTVLKLLDDSVYAFTEQDPTMSAGCSGCLGACKIVLLKYNMFGNHSILSATGFKSLAGRPPDLSLYDFSTLSDEAIALGEALDADNMICESGVNEFGSMIAGVAGKPEQIMAVIDTLGLHVAPQIYS
ncbi:unnamed protein product [Phytophthora lilii]|uniref:Unnamed protein product n=1 Tax=Phytophthora lilii TaxID=2077276 RepID=A0A9W6WHL5_9STRA|nr:unnamed protein product [Phytophthora lilii]